MSGTGSTPGTIATMQINAPFMGLYGGAQVTVTANGQILGSTTGLTDFQIHDATIFGGGSIGNAGTRLPETACRSLSPRSARSTPTAAGPWC